MTIPFLDLTVEQQLLLKRLKEPGHHVVSGPPGSGKSLLAVHHAAQARLMGEPTTLLAHSKLLKQHLNADAAGLGADIEVLTFHAWVHAWYRQSTGSSLSARSGQFDWTELVRASLQNAGRREQTFVVDEGQDLPPQFYQLCRLIGARIIAFADEYQRITDTQSTLNEIETALGRCTRHEIVENLRNPRPVAELAIRYSVGFHTLPPPIRDGPTPVLLHLPDQRRPFVQWLADYASARRRLSVGVVLKYTRMQQELLADLERIGHGLRPQIYVGGAPTDRHRTIDPARSGIRLINRASIKGLEFDTVIIPDTHLDRDDPTSAEIRMMYYVLTTRARSELYFCYSGVREPPILADAPESLLTRSLLQAPR
ncbi:hypothetical protein [Streptosporangium sp. NPDC049304]|uniref:hypothetical protein n=1 Tax=Streptosporangium sp. NPDC049304 TaxID=3154830 RepID=UPI003443E539